MRRLTALLLICIVILVPAVASAAEDGSEEKPATFSIHTVDQDGEHFELEMAPGEERELTVALRNGGDEYDFALTYKADMFSKVNGGFAARDQEAEISGETAWVDYPTEQLDIGPDDDIFRKFTVRVPEDAEPGKYIAALLIQNAEASAMSNDGLIEMQGFTRNMIGVIIEVPGPEQPAWEFGDGHYEVRSENSIVELDIANTGNTWMNGTGEFWLETEDGVEFGRQDVEMKTIYPSRETRLRVVIEGHLDPGDYYAFAHLTDENSGVVANGERIVVHVPEPESDEDGGLAGLIQPPRMPGDGGSGSWWTLLGIIAAVSLLAAIIGVLIGRQRSRANVAAVSSDPILEPDPQPSPAMQANLDQVTRPQPASKPGGLRPLVPKQ